MPQSFCCGNLRFGRELQPTLAIVLMPCSCGNPRFGRELQPTLAIVLMPCSCGNLRFGRELQQKGFVFMLFKCCGNLRFGRELQQRRKGRFFLKIRLFVLTLRKMLQTMSKFRKITFEKYKAFEDFTIDCGDFQWTVLLGNNNTGKTSLLRRIAGFKGAGKIDYRNIINKDTVKKHNPLTLQLPFPDGCKVVYEFTDDKIANPLYAYGVSRYPAKTSLSDQESGDCDTLFFHDRRVVTIEDRLTQGTHRRKGSRTCTKI